MDNTMVKRKRTVVHVYNDLQNTTQKTNDWAAWNLTKNGMNSGARRVTVKRQEHQLNGYCVTHQYAVRK
jgi:hypothetical protein